MKKNNQIPLDHGRIPLCVWSEDAGPVQLIPAYGFVANPWVRTISVSKLQTVQKNKNIGLLN